MERRQRQMCIRDGAAVVFIPLTCVGTILIAIKRSWRKSLGWWVLAIAFLSVGFAAVAKESGEALAKKIGDPVTRGEPLARAYFSVDESRWSQARRLLEGSFEIGGEAVSPALVIDTVESGETGR